MEFAYYLLCFVSREHNMMHKKRLYYSLFLSSTLLRPSQTLLRASVCHTFPKKLEFQPPAPKKKMKKKMKFQKTLLGSTLLIWCVCLYFTLFQKKWNLYWILDFWRPPARGRRPLPVNRNYSYYLGPTPHISIDILLFITNK